MGLMTGSGPFGKEPAGTFNFEPPPPGRALYLEPTPKRIRVVVGGETIADSRGAYLLHEAGHQPIYYFPPGDVRADVLEPSDRHTRCPKKGEASYHTIRVGDQVVDAGAWYYPEVLEGAPPELAGLIAFYFNRMERWIEEDEEIFGHPRDPYHRIDVRQSNRRVEVSLDGQLLASTDRAAGLFESNLPARWYMPLEDVVAELEPSEKTSYCPYKGQASYYSVRLADGSLIDDLVWYYPHPLMDAARIEGLVCFFNERVDLSLDGELAERPESPWSHGVKDAVSQNAPVAQTRG
ncbi:MAG TPA: DUF427 domain-containing protein [Solirubrobacteraceae bacterium]|jgi:uncharacterized protein (DUF427 family)